MVELPSRGPSRMALGRPPGRTSCSSSWKQMRGTKRNDASRTRALRGSQRVLTGLRQPTGGFPSTTCAPNVQHIAQPLAPLPRSHLLALGQLRLRAVKVVLHKQAAHKLGHGVAAKGGSTESRGCWADGTTEAHHTPCECLSTRHRQAGSRGAAQHAVLCSCGPASPHLYLYASCMSHLPANKQTDWLQ